MCYIIVSNIVQTWKWNILFYFKGHVVDISLRTKYGMKI